MRLLSEYDGEQNSRGVLNLNAPAFPGSSTSVRDVLIEKHPQAANATPDALIDVGQVLPFAKPHCAQRALLVHQA